MPERRAPRQDALRNRSRLVETAASAFAAQGLGASVNTIARDTGVNVATLYRHFPTKDDLIVAVSTSLLEPLASARDRALADPGDPLATFLQEAVRPQAGHRGLVDALGEVHRQLREPAIELVTPLVEHAHATGSLRADFGPLDLLIALRLLASVAEPGADRPGRFVDVVLRGLRPD